jgi:hypothetical protein
MKKRIVAAVAGGVWLAAIGSAAALTYTLDRPIVLVHTSSSQAATTQSPTQLLEAAQEETTIDPSALVMPEAIIVGNPSSARPGVAEMQGADDVTIGPGVVSYPPKD